MTSTELPPSKVIILFISPSGPRYETPHRFHLKLHFATIASSVRGINILFNEFSEFTEFIKIVNENRKNSTDIKINCAMKFTVGFT